MFILGSLLVSLLLVNSVKADASAKATSLGLNTTWTAPMPSSALSSGSGYISSNWFASQGFYGAENVEFVQDPFSGNSTTPILKVNYPAGSYAPVGTKNNNSGVKGGAEFFTSPNHNKMYNTALLSYDIAFDSSFDWVKGGKLPGIYGGNKCILA